jgi:hypothetical protein
MNVMEDYPVAIFMVGMNAVRMCSSWETRWHRWSDRSKGISVCSRCEIMDIAERKVNIFLKRPDRSVRIMKIHQNRKYSVYTKTHRSNILVVSYRLSKHYEAILTGVCSCRTCTPSRSLYSTSMHCGWFRTPVNWNLVPCQWLSVEVHYNNLTLNSFFLNVLCSNCYDHEITCIRSISIQYIYSHCYIYLRKAVLIHNYHN